MPSLFQLPKLKINSRANKALVVVWPWKNKYTRGSNPDPGYALAIDKPLFLEKYVMSITVQTSKRNHVSAATVTLKDPVNLAPNIDPTSWMGIWLFDNNEDYKRVKKAIEKKAPANLFRDGLKFIGRVQGISRNIAIDPKTGRVQKQLSIAGGGFVEFDSVVYFDPALDFSTNNPNLFMQRLITGMQEVVDLKNTDVNEAISRLLNIFIGNGPNDIVKGNKMISPNSMFLVPADIGRVLSNTTIDPQATRITYSALLRRLMGIQKYPGTIKDKEWAPLIPKLDNPNNTHHFQTGNWMQGSFGAQVNAWPGVPIWSILTQFLNPAVNEMYTCLRAAPNDGTIQPTLVVRQIPFTTELLGNSNAVTRFLELPRWVVPIENVMQAQTAKSRSLDVNFVQVTNINPPGAAGKYELAQQRANSPPSVDYNDLYRNGMNGVITTTNTFMPTILSTGVKGGNTGTTVGQTVPPPPPSNVVGKPVTVAGITLSPVPSQAQIQGLLPQQTQDKQAADQRRAEIFSKENKDKAAPARWWTILAADRLMGGHLRWSGQFVVKGIQEPICEGDNLQVGDTVYHIEQVAHQMQVDPNNGMIVWNTQLMVSNGVPETGEPVVTQSPDAIDTLIPVSTLVEKDE